MAGVSQPKAVGILRVKVISKLVDEQEKGNVLCYMGNLGSSGGENWEHMVK